ncbi:MAG: hypothetical protein ABEJ31_02700 [Haloarculaceae archaeon]
MSQTALGEVTAWRPDRDLSVSKKAVGVSAFLIVLININALMVSLLAVTGGGIIGGFLASYMAGGSVRGIVNGLVAGLIGGLVAGFVTILIGGFIGMYLEPPTLSGSFLPPLSMYFDVYGGRKNLLVGLGIAFLVTVDAGAGAVVGSLVRAGRDELEDHF